ncbi:MAG: hypothetical protein ACQEWG_12860 [Bacteroidota bacterium]
MSITETRCKHQLKEKRKQLSKRLQQQITITVTAVGFKLLTVGVIANPQVKQR